MSLGWVANSANMTLQYDIAVQLSDALDKYLMDEIHIEFVDGWPIAYQLNEQMNESDTDI